MDREREGRPRARRRPKPAPADGPAERRGRVSEWDAAGTSRRRRVYLVLGAIALTAAIASVVLHANPWVDRFGPNLATEVLGIILTLVFVHRFLEHQDRARRLRASIGALRRGSRALRRLLDAWGALIRGALPGRPAERPVSLDALLAPHITEALARCDPAAVRQDGDGTTWTRWAVAELRAAQQTLHEIVVTYGASLDPAYVEAVDDLIDDPFIAFFGRLADAAPDARTWRVRLNSARALREAHFERLLATVRLHNAIAAEAATVRTRRSAPRSGSLGVSLGLDHDLRVEPRLEPGWWDGMPAAGSLTAEPAG